MKKLFNLKELTKFAAKQFTMPKGMKIKDFEKELKKELKEGKIKIKIMDVKKSNNMNDEILVPKIWFEGLLKHAKRTRKLSKNSTENNLKIALPELLGYISSAKTILKYNKVKLDDKL